MIRSTVRDATHVIDGLLDHGTDIRIEEHYTDTGGVSEHILGCARMAESICDGKVSASLLVSKLAAYPQHSELALTLRELGRVEPTLFTLDWLQKPELRRRAHIGLSKGELRNSLAKALRFYRCGAVADRDRENNSAKPVVSTWPSPRSASGTPCTCRKHPSPDYCP